MLKELRKIKGFGSKDSIQYLIKNVVGKNAKTYADIIIICNNTLNKFELFAKDVFNYCCIFKWIILDKDKYIVNDEIRNILNNNGDLKDYLIKDTLHTLFDNNYIHEDIIKFDRINEKYYIQKESISLDLAPVRNALILLDFMKKDSKLNHNYYYINSSYDSFIALLCKKYRIKISLEQLKQKILKDEEVGLLAENYVVSFEQKRLPKIQGKIKKISDIDVMAGYDIVSFEDETSIEYNRFIEVKAISENGFYWSNNEYQKAKLLGNQYFLYLVEVSKIKEDSYSPIIIKNPAVVLKSSSNWNMETQTYKVTKCL